MYRSQAPVIGHTRAHAPPLTPPHAAVGGQKSRFQAKNRKVTARISVIQGPLA
ncbi:hypothetical protein V6Z12_A05G360800 [Gossypium hirsutum]